MQNVLVVPFVDKKQTKDAKGLFVQVNRLQRTTNSLPPNITVLRRTVIKLSSTTMPLSDRIQKLVDLWLSWDKNQKTRQEIEQLAKQENEKELDKRLGSRIAFGTAGKPPM